MKEADGKTGEPAGFGEIRKAYQERIRELAKYGAEEGTAINPESQEDFEAFIEQRPRWRKGLTELLNNGNLRAVWKDDAGNRLGLQFLGGQKLEYVIFRRRPNPGKSSGKPGETLSPESTSAWRSRKCSGSQPDNPQEVIRMNQATKMAEEALERFAKGKNDRQPEPQAIETARRLAEASLSRTRDAEIVMDHEGDLAFDLRNEKGKLILAELTPEGRLHAGLYGADNAALASINDGREEDMLAWLDA